MNRVIFIVDGFNVYHSLVQAQQDSRGQTAKWLDLQSLCTSYLPLVASATGKRASLEHIYYFSASPTHRAKEKQDRHALYMQCLAASGISVQLGRFKPKDITCPQCRCSFRRHEEKETDVAIATRLFEVCYADEADSIVMMTGDTDLAPTVRVCQRLFPTKHILFAFPYRRANTELQKLAPQSFAIKLKSCLAHQYPDSHVLPDGTIVKKPSTW